MTRSAIALVGCALALNACDAPGPIDPAGDPLFNRSGDVRVVARASGEYRIGVSPTRFAALLKGDGRVLGDFHIATPAGIVAGDVVCLSVAENGAWMGFQVTTTTNPNVIVGSYGGFRVIDNGEGANAEPDRASGVFVNQTLTTILNYCSNRPAAVTLPLIEGNIQVR